MESAMKILAHGAGIVLLLSAGNALAQEEPLPSAPVSDEFLAELIAFDPILFGPETSEFMAIVTRFTEETQASVAGGLQPDAEAELPFDPVSAISELTSSALNPAGALAESPLFDELSAGFLNVVLDESNLRGLSTEEVSRGLADGILSNDSVESEFETLANFERAIVAATSRDSTLLLGADGQPLVMTDFTTTLAALALEWGADALARQELVDDSQEGEEQPLGLAFNFTGAIAGVLIEQTVVSATQSQLTNAIVDSETGVIDPSSIDFTVVASSLSGIFDNLPEEVVPFVSPAEALGSIVDDLVLAGLNSSEAIAGVLDAAQSFATTLPLSETNIGAEQNLFLSNTISAAARSFAQTLLPDTIEQSETASMALPEEVLLASLDLINGSTTDPLNGIAELALLQSNILADSDQLNVILPRLDPEAVAAFEELFVSAVETALPDSELISEGLGAGFTNTLLEESENARRDIVRGQFASTYAGTVASIIADAAEAGDAEAVEQLSDMATSVFLTQLTNAGEASTGLATTVETIVEAVAARVDLEQAPNLVGAIAEGILAATASTDTRSLLVGDDALVEQPAVRAAFDVIVDDRFQAVASLVTQAVVEAVPAEAGAFVTEVTQATLRIAVEVGLDQKEVIAATGAIVAGAEEASVALMRDAITADPDGSEGASEAVPRIDLASLLESVASTIVEAVNENEALGEVFVDSVDTETLAQSLEEAAREDAARESVRADGSDDIDIVSPEDFVSAS